MRLYRFLILALVCQAAMVLPAAAAKRVALVIGNAAYVQAGALTNPVNDAADMAKALTQFGFDVTLGLDLDRRAFDEKLRAFARSLDDADTAMLFYAGHGLQVAGRNYLVPVDAGLSTERDLDFEAIGLDFVLRQMEVGREGKTTIVFLDACRDNPLARNLARSMGTRSAAIGKGLAEVQTGAGTFIAYSTQPGNVALDGAGRNSPFTAALAARILEPGRNLNATMIEVRKDVLKATDGRQVPWDHSALTSDFFFQPEAQAAASAPVLPAAAQELIQARLRAIEEQVNSKADRQQTLNLVKVEQLKERVRQLEEAMRQDQQRIFDTYNKNRPSNDAESRSNLSLEIGSIQIQMSRRGQEKKALQEQIEKLSAELGMTEAKAK
ncbi:MAG: caspase family protein [Rhodomicrobium sp.]